LQFYILQETYRLWPEKDLFKLTDPSRLEMFDKVCGTDKIRIEFTKTWQVSSILDIWSEEIHPFRKKVDKYLLY
jgi:uncharacterized protein YbbC (DUF1343 family)